MKHISTALIVVLTIFLTTGCEKWKLDKQMEELCAKDGGVKVYETVTLPPEMFDKDGYPFPGWQLRKVKERFGSEYIYEGSTQVLNDGDPTAGGGRLDRVEHHIIRRSDNKIMGVSIVYVRLGGDGVPIGHPSGKTCPSGKDTLATEVFIKGGTQSE